MQGWPTLTSGLTFSFIWKELYTLLLLLLNHAAHPPQDQLSALAGILEASHTQFLTTRSDEVRSSTSELTVVMPHDRSRPVATFFSPLQNKRSVTELVSVQESRKKEVSESPHSAISTSVASLLSPCLFLSHICFVLLFHHVRWQLELCWAEKLKNNKIKGGFYYEGIRHVVTKLVDLY